MRKPPGLPDQASANSRIRAGASLKTATRVLSKAPLLRFRLLAATRGSRGCRLLSRPRDLRLWRNGCRAPWSHALTRPRLPASRRTRRNSRRLRRPSRWTFGDRRLHSFLGDRSRRRRRLCSDRCWLCRLRRRLGDCRRRRLLCDDRRWRWRGRWRRCHGRRRARPRFRCLLRGARRRGQRP